jgi:hypothetical protein
MDLFYLFLITFSLVCTSAAALEMMFVVVFPILEKNIIFVLLLCNSYLCTHGCCSLMTRCIFNRTFKR